MKISYFCVLAFFLFCLFISNAYGQWFDDFYPYRVELILENDAQGDVDIQITLDDIIKQIEKVSPDIIDIDNFAFEKAVLVEPVSQKIVGSFKLSLDSENLIKDSNFSSLGKAGTPWYGFNPSDMKITEVQTTDEEISAVMIEKKAIANTKLSQPITLETNSFYLLDYWLYNNLSDNDISVQLENPTKRLFAYLPASYIPKMTPIKQWTHCKSLVRPDVSKPNFNITTAYIGQAGVGHPRLRKATWRLLANLTAKSSELHLYYVPRAGHKLTCPNEKMIADTKTIHKTVTVISAEAVALNPNTNGVLFEGEYLRAWTLPNDFPLKTKYLKNTFPKEGTNAKTVQIRIFKGGDTTVLIAIQTNTPYIQFSNLQCNVPAEVRFDYLAPIPVYNGPFPSDDFIGTYLDAMMNPNDSLKPACNNGIHVLAITFTASQNTQSGIFDSKIKFTVQTQVPRIETVEIPVKLTISPLTIKPMDHFGVLFGTGLLQLRHADHPAFKDQPGISIADFHGFPYDTAKTDWVNKMSLKDQNELTSNPFLKLSQNYDNRLLDFDIQPIFVPQNVHYTYKVTDREDNKAPTLSDWNFKEWDKALDKFMIDRQVPWLSIWHTNGHVMHFLRLNNGITYSIKPNPDNDHWKQLPEQEYFSLWGNYFDTLAEHLHEKGYLDKTLFIIDESQSYTYDIMLKMKREFKKHTFASRIKFVHTGQQTAAYTKQKEDGSLIMNEVLDLTMPINNDHFNFFESEYNKLFKTPKDHWVYYVETDHHNIINAGISTMITPLKLKHFGANGWYCWTSLMWSMNYPVEDDGPEFKTGKVVNPWLNPFYHHGPGTLSFFYPPDPRGISPKPTVKITPSYRLSLIRDGVQARALLEALTAGKDDTGQTVKVNQTKLNQAQKQLDKLWANNPVQWYISYGAYKNFHDLLWEAIEQ
jgi:hypothetical protein